VASKKAEANAGKIFAIFISVTPVSWAGLPSRAEVEHQRLFWRRLPLDIGGADLLSAQEAHSSRGDAAAGSLARSRLYGKSWN
jgi:hypothetical protein